ncbi:uncharacterized protein LOC132754718 isoform X2 [Ruditapes philippinarum]|uniref:uncharacterized protein LOC132754718 isoform X2 n=1 Tax=Ruditapes philippinarum TaxID=129788 RepID=UPI00295AC676|nr:uncharacterized protein LOC132754718 isoform X2 [Ruditapes philippinarum]
MDESGVLENSEGNTNTFKKLKCTLTTLVAVAIVNMSVLLPLVVHLHLLRQHKIESVWCSQGNHDLLDQLMVKTNKDMKQYRNNACGKLSDMLQKVVNLNKSYNSDTGPEPEFHGLDITTLNCTVSEKVESTLYLYNVLSHAKPVPGKNTKVYWGPITYLITHHMKYEEGTIYIKQSGYYFVLSLLTVRVHNMKSVDTVINFGDETRHVVNVIQHTDGTERVLLQNVKTTCVLSFDNGEWSSNIGAPFYLNEQDRVYVATSHPYNIVSGHSNSYLSIHTIL